VWLFLCREYFHDYIKESLRVCMLWLSRWLQSCRGDSRPSDVVSCVNLESCVRDEACVCSEVRVCGAEKTE
jgi:hypothetical protein